jgi:hypothetical protein
MKAILGGIIFLICGIIAIFLSDLLAIWLCFGFGAWLIILGMRSNNSKQQTPPTGLNVPEQKNVPPMPAPAPQPINTEPLEPWQELKLPEPFKTITIKPAGTTFECAFSQYYENRQDVLKFAGFGTKISFKQYTFKGEPAIALMYDALQSDIGNVPRDKVEMVTDFLRKYDCIGIVSESGSFFPESDDDEENEDSELIYYCKILLYAYKRPEIG